jgi:hypothetical protein
MIFKFYWVNDLTLFETELKKPVKFFFPLTKGCIMSSVELECPNPTACPSSCNTVTRNNSSSKLDYNLFENLKSA